MRHDPDSDPAALKAALRARLRQARGARQLHDREAAGLGIARSAESLLPAGTSAVACYRSMPTEPGTEPLLRALHEQEVGVWLPRIHGRDLRWVLTDRGSRYATGPLGIREPTGEGVPSDEALGTATVVLLPALAVDADGRRLGQGGGFYDRTVSALTPHADGGPLLAAVLFDEEILAAVPVEPHDCRVAAVVTPTRVVRLDTPSA